MQFTDDIFKFVFCEADVITQGVKKKGMIKALKETSRVLRKGGITVGSVSSRYTMLFLELLKAKSVTI